MKTSIQRTIRGLAIAALLVTATGGVLAQTANGPTITVADVTMEQGQEATVDINCHLTADRQYVGFKFRVVLPDGLTLAEDPENEGYPWYDDMLPSIAALNITTTAGGSFAATPRSATAAIGSSEGVLMRIRIKAAETVASGTTATAKLTGVSLNYRDGSYNVSKTTLPDVTFAVNIGKEEQGDLNGDNNVDVGDIMAIINFMAAPSGEAGAYDLNGDGSVDVGDIMAIINIMAQ